MKKSYALLNASILFLLNAGIVAAAPFDLVNQKLRWIFFSLPASTAFAVWLKFSFFVIIFAALYNGGLRALKAEGPLARALGVISFIIALTTAIFVPYNLILYIFKVYGVILVILFAVLPVIVGLFISKTIAPDDNNRGHRVIRGALYIILSIFLFGLIGHIQANSSPLTQIFDQILTPLWFGAFIIFLLGVYNLVMAVLPKKKDGVTTENKEEKKREEAQKKAEGTKTSGEAKGAVHEKKKGLLKRMRDKIWPKDVPEGEPLIVERKQLLENNIKLFAELTYRSPTSLHKRVMTTIQYYDYYIGASLNIPQNSPSQPHKTAKDQAQLIIKAMYDESFIEQPAKQTDLIKGIFAYSIQLKTLLEELNYDEQYPYVSEEIKEEFLESMIRFFELQVKIGEIFILLENVGVTEIGQLKALRKELMIENPFSYR